MTIQQLKNEIRAKIYENNTGRITGQDLQDVLIDIANKIDETTAIVGKDGEDGVGIRNISTASTTTGITATIHYTDGTVGPTLKIKNGTSGKDGKDGRDGMDGRDGIDGINGRDGRDGRNGVDGTNGRDGAQGPQGKAGAQGPAGAKGEKGDRGLQGPPGPAGQGGYGDQSLFDSLEEELQQFKQAVSARMDSISSTISSEASAAISRALANLNLTAESMNNLQAALRAAQQNANDALTRIRALEDLIGDDGEIDMSALTEALAQLEQFQAWLDDIGDGYTQILADYDAGKRLAGQIGYGYDPARGLFTWFGESISTLSGNVGTVRRDMDASQGLIRDVATWYDESRSGITSAWTAIDAMNGRIESVVEDVTESAVTRALSSIDGRLGEISQMIDSMSGFSGEVLTHLESRMSAAEAKITQTINRQNGLSGSIVSIDTRLDGVQGSVSTAVTQANAALTEATRMADTWNQESGMMRTVADLTIKKDSDGEPIFWYIASGQTGDTVEKTRVYYKGKDNQGRTVFNSKKNGTGTNYFYDVYPDYMTGAFSYMNQKANSIEMGVSSGAVLAAFNMTATPDGSKINMTADRINLDAEVFARSFSAITANLGGVKMGYGVISAGSRNGDYWELKENGTGTFTGNINAKSLTLGQGVTIPGVVTSGDVNTMMRNAASVSGWGITDGGDYIQIDNWVSSSTLGTKFKVDKNGLLTASNAVISGSVYATNGYFAGTIEGSNIIVGNGSIKFTNGGTNTFEISAGDISVDYTPQTYFSTSYDNWPTTYYQSEVSGFTSGVMSVTGQTGTPISVTIPSITGSCSWSQAPDSTPVAEVYAFITSGTSWANLENGYGNAPTTAQCVAYTSATVTLNGTLPSFVIPSLTKGLLGNTTTTGRTYYWGYVWKISNYGYGNVPTLRVTVPSTKVTLVASTASDTQYLRIGSNGIQIFLGEGFYFTAAKDPQKGPTISFAGSVGGTMKYFKIDRNGVIMPNE